MSDPIDGLSLLESTDLSSVDTSFPILAPATIDCVISEMEVKPNKAGTGSNLHIKLTTAMPAKSNTGVDKPAGFPLRDLVSLTPTDKYDPKQRLAQIREAVHGDKNGAFGSPASYIGKPVTVRVKIESSIEYGDQNRIAAYVKKA